MTQDLFGIMGLVRDQPHLNPFIQCSCGHKMLSLVGHDLKGRGDIQSQKHSERNVWNVLESHQIHMLYPFHFVIIMALDHTRRQEKKNCSPLP